jgi:hypothetical protein
VRWTSESSRHEDGASFEHGHAAIKTASNARERLMNALHSTDFIIRARNKASPANVPSQGRVPL